MSQTSRLIVLLLLSTAIALLSTSSNAITEASSSSALDDSSSSTVDDPLDSDSDCGSDDCTGAQVSAIEQILTTNTQYQACESKFGGVSSFNTTSVSQICDYPACVSALETLNSTLPECTYNGVTLSDQAGSLLTVCKSSNSTNSSSSPTSDGLRIYQNGFAFALASMALLTLG